MNEDLLGRKTIQLKKDSIRKENKTVLVTEPLSIGEISRQLLNYPCKKWCC